MTTMRSVPNVVAAFVALLASLASAPIGAQTPDTDIFVAELRVVGGTVEIGAPRNITSREGYDNQPWFIPDSEALLYAADVDGQTDIFEYDLATGERTRLTHTPENEFSPSRTMDGEMLAVRWAADMSDGHLWRYSADGTPLGAHAADVARIGYYGVVDEMTMAAFVNDSARSFVLADGRTGRRTKLGEGLGGSPPQRIPGEDAVSFVQPDEAGVAWIRRLDLATHKITPIAETLPDVVSYAWLPGGLLLMPHGNAIFVRDSRTDAGWREVARFDDAALALITRIAVDATGDRIALVAARAESR